MQLCRMVEWYDDDQVAELNHLLQQSADCQVVDCQVVGCGDPVRCKEGLTPLDGIAMLISNPPPLSKQVSISVPATLGARWLYQYQLIPL